jgi:hypothetical protein
MKGKKKTMKEIKKEKGREVEFWVEDLEMKRNGKWYNGVEINHLFR